MATLSKLLFEKINKQKQDNSCKTCSIITAQLIEGSKDPQMFLSLILTDSYKNSS